MGPIAAFLWMLLRSFFTLLLAFIGVEIRKLFWMLFITLPMFFLKQLFTKAVLPWWAMAVVCVLSWIFWF